ncbi:3-hydroxybutyrate dehydrogenase [Lysinibacillus odysseyi]|uniref:3-hydroxybutyrate dehydrogenase n=1 Tax=Lysinibacillus odysseyi 34hs-1 = NBRC 100172 TaxID=1220589 RepID=A0A0A3JJM3_9BACI|nr:3-hydroxybutyrate dehydrogenase [Lysinibacillus odysseyi]KGR87197.1 3-hydroxybutyrate dehydrogenase [Lysinibacillus odysseyi 34hs-1 = NBRC 100172]
MKDKVVFITGAARGIGYEIAQAFLEEGAKVMISDINEESLEKALEGLSENAAGIACDVSKEEDVKRAVDATVEQFGSIDILINNAGLQHVAMIEDFPAAKFEQMLKIMLVGPFLTTKYALPYMKEKNFGRIINISSINGLIGFAGKSAYNSAKHGVIGLTKVTALETAEYNITANAICPGYADTALVRGQFEDLAKTRNISTEQVLNEVLFPLIPQKRLLDVAEIASLAKYLASEESRGMTGQSLVLDGGYTTQ